MNAFQFRIMNHINHINCTILFPSLNKTDAPSIMPTAIPLPDPAPHPGVTSSSHDSAGAGQILQGNDLQDGAIGQEYCPDALVDTFARVELEGAGWWFYTNLAPSSLH